MLVNQDYVLATIASGAWSGNTPTFSGAMLLQVVVKATTNTTVFDFNLTDKYGVIVAEWKDIGGELNAQVSIPLRGIYTKAISNSTKDEDFKVELNVDEN